MTQDFESDNPAMQGQQEASDVTEESCDAAEESLDRRGFLDLTFTWSKAALMAVLAVAGVVGSEEEAEAARGSWVNRRGGGGWVNARGGGGGWVNRGGGGGWVNVRGGGGGGWVNRRGGGGAWVNVR